ncbi:MAG: hypothetical protein WCT18_04775 [Patescibacteria group bacterium]
MNNKQEAPFEEKIMEKIKASGVKIRSKYIFLAEKISWRGLLALCTVLAIIFFSLTVFYFKGSDNLHYLKFGRRGIPAFFESLPFIFSGLLILFVIIANLVIKKSKIFYEKPFYKISLFLLSAIIVLGALLTMTNFGLIMERRAHEKAPEDFLFRPMFERNSKFREHGIAGKVSELDSGKKLLQIETPFGFETINLTKANTPADLKIADFIMAVGNKKENIFWAEEIKIFDPEEMPMIHNGIKRHFCEKNTPPFGQPNNCPNRPESTSPIFPLNQ